MDGFKWIVVATEMVQDSLGIKEQFENGLLLNPVHIIKNREELLAYLKGTGIYANRQKFPLPKVLILDLQLPDRGAWDVLEYLSSEPALIEEVRTIVLTAPGQEKEVERAYELGAKSYLFKPFSFADFLQRSRIIGVNWVLIGTRG
jgi:CheY-like chemotaxis protein